MKRSFTLPRSAITRLAIQWVIGLAIGIALVYLNNGEESLSTLLWLLPAALALLVAIAWYIKQYKYVHLSADGIHGRPTSGFKMRHISWAEQVTFKTASLNGLKGQLLTSTVSAQSIFIPKAILLSPEFIAYLAQYAPLGHPLRTTEF